MKNSLSQAHQQITCPYCFSHFTLQDVHFRCINPSCTSKGNDNEYARSRGTNRIIMGRVLLPLPKKSKSIFHFTVPYELLCSSCQVVSTTRLCPKCHYALPSNIEQCEQKVIAIIGGRATGKTHYIAALIHRLTHTIDPDFSITVTSAGDETQERWMQDFYTPLFS
ncbi:hypothetical protein [Dictyobacter arantiisoli]|uniref:Uncharacterized protein n=1 Tax=Dictyobacter arantiisoli TaxID=2014874 RepID=A0A5A5TBU0_9CHLR|nr:hypothetical protein [Dictyobacter arantiisoli]GCF08695.1 hypothetical protein KDI_22590 [Dictyobacter arantiisoli]